MKRWFTVFTLVAATGLSTHAATITYFSASLSQDHVVKGGIAGTAATGRGTATFVLTQPDVGEPTLRYDIGLVGADLDGAQTPNMPADNVTGIHLHNTAVCIAPGCQVGDTGGTMHVLNLFGFPRADDGDMTYDAAASTVSGLWDASDKNALTPLPSGKPSEFLTELFNGKLFLMVHTQGVPTGAYGGFLTRVPEPAGLALLLTGVCWLLIRRRQGGTAITFCHEASVRNSRGVVQAPKW